MSGLLILRGSRTYCEQVYMHQTGSAYFAYIHIFFTIFPILMLTIKKLKTSHFIIWLAQRAHSKSANTSARIGFLNAGQDHIGLDFCSAPRRKSSFCHMLNPFLAKLIRSRWLHIGPAQNTKKNFAKMCSHINPMHA